MTSFHICRSLEEAAAQIAQCSYAIYEVDVETTRLIQNAWVEGKRVLNNPPSSCQRIVKGNLHGYHTPSQTKRLFRAFCQSNDQPWPDPVFRTASQSLAEELHTILLLCLDMIAKEVSTATCQTNLARKRRRHTMESLHNSCINISQLGKRVALEMCPLDYFLYHNQRKLLENCSEHVDRGVLIAICMSVVPGLEVRECDQITFSCPEVELHNKHLFEDNSATTKWICILAGDELSQALSSTGYNIPACVHRVKKNLKRARLSISYEVRCRDLGATSHSQEHKRA